MRKKSVLGVVLGAAALLGVSAPVAFAGEITGNGKPITINGRSECAYSGRNDGYFTGEEPGRTQSYGQIVRYTGSLGGVPGTACNPVKSTGAPE